MIDQDLDVFFDADEFGETVTYNETGLPIVVIVDLDVQIQHEGHYPANSTVLNAKTADVAGLQKDSYFTRESGAKFNFLEMIADDGHVSQFVVSITPAA